MKNVLYCAAALAAMFFTACQQEVLEPVADGNTVTYSVNVSTAATKAIGDDVTDVNTLYYEVYRAADVANLDADPIYEGQKGIVDGKSSFELEFVKNQEFVVLFWAQNSSLAMFDVTDLGEVALTTPGDSNDLNAQVFAGSDVVTNCVSAASGSVKLVRPISQLNIATTPESLGKFQDVCRHDGSGLRNAQAPGLSYLQSYLWLRHGGIQVAQRVRQSILD